jgi:CRISPR/Cas system CSM-associated protein Csm3 (group 7 of RAMP superfamily)
VVTSYNAVTGPAGDGLPYVPGTSLTGVLREACRVVAIALDEGWELFGGL